MTDLQSGLQIDDDDDVWIDWFHNYGDWMFQYTFVIRWVGSNHKDTTRNKSLGCFHIENSAKEAELEEALIYSHRKLMITKNGAIFLEMIANHGISG